jgi:hypothetical protein
MVTAPVTTAYMVARLTAAGYRARFEVVDDRLVCRGCRPVHPADVVVEHVLSARGRTVYGVECLACRVKGTWPLSVPPTDVGTALLAWVRRIRSGPSGLGAQGLPGRR